MHFIMDHLWMYFSVETKSHKASNRNFALSVSCRILRRTGEKTYWSGVIFNTTYQQCAELKVLRSRWHKFQYTTKPTNTYFHTYLLPQGPKQVLGCGRQAHWEHWVIIVKAEGQQRKNWSMYNFREPWFIQILFLYVC